MWVWFSQTGYVNKTKIGLSNLAIETTVNDHRVGKQLSKNKYLTTVDDPRVGNSCQNKISNPELTLIC